MCTLHAISLKCSKCSQLIAYGAKVGPCLPAEQRGWDCAELENDSQDVYVDEQGCGKCHPSGCTADCFKFHSKDDAGASGGGAAGDNAAGGSTDAANKGTKA